MTRSGLALALALAFASAASAHAILVGSQPKEASEVTGPDVQVSLEFNSRIDASRSTLTLLPGGANAGDLAPVGAGGPEELSLASSEAPNKLEATASGLAPGTYRLLWQVLSVDGHVSRGNVTFKVRAP
ncbi:MAG TPA: copper resistance CopC family protein [Myxococcota bacterium]|nr:copper resistance CopC family protein [Myxococcota bacterium]